MTTETQNRTWVADVLMSIILSGIGFTLLGLVFAAFAWAHLTHPDGNLTPGIMALVFASVFAFMGVCLAFFNIGQRDD